MSGIVFDICPPSCIIDMQSVGLPDAIAGVPKPKTTTPKTMSIRPAKAMMRDANIVNRYHEIVHAGKPTPDW